MNASEKINGYTKEEAKNLVEYIWTGKKAGKTLTALFKAYGDEHGRARGSVRNYYYALMRNAKSDERVMKLLDGKDLAVEKIREFTEEETHEALKSILAEKSKGVSVRRAILNIAGEDQKKMLRLQNKYRNVLKKQPEKIMQAQKELGIKTSQNFINKSSSKNRAAQQPAEDSLGKKAPNRKNAPCGEFLKRRLEQEINSLYERIAGALREENQRLRTENERLKRRLENKF